MLIAVWIVVALLLALWSLGAWGLHALLTLDATALSDLKPMVERIPYGELLSRWVPGWQDLVHLLIDLTQTVLGWIGGAAPVVVWVAWGVGALLLLLLGGLLSLVVALIRKSAAAPAA
jgi:hypothetical protein